MAAPLIILDEKSPLLQNLDTIAASKLNASQYYAMTYQEAKTQLTQALIDSLPQGSELIFISPLLTDLNLYEKRLITEIKYSRPAWILVHLPPPRRSLPV